MIILRHQILASAILCCLCLPAARAIILQQPSTSKLNPQPEPPSVGNKNVNLKNTNAQDKLKLNPQPEPPSVGLKKLPAQ